MSDPAADIAAAERRAAQAKLRLTDTLGRLQLKLKPKTIARDAARSAANMGQNAAETARANPAPIAGAVAALGLFFARHRIVALFRRNKQNSVSRPRKASDNPTRKGRKS